MDQRILCEIGSQLPQKKHPERFILASDLKSTHHSSNHSLERMTLSEAWTLLKNHTTVDILHGLSAGRTLGSAPSVVTHASFDAIVARRGRVTDKR
jgi:hypothetical protein